MDMDRADRPYLRRSSPLVHSHRYDYIVSADRRTVYYRASPANPPSQAAATTRRRSGVPESLRSWEALESALDTYDDERQFSPLDTHGRNSDPVDATPNSFLQEDHPYESPDARQFSSNGRIGDYFERVSTSQHTTLEKIEPRSIFDLMAGEYTRNHVTPTPDRLTTQRQSTISPQSILEVDAFDGAIESHAHREVEHHVDGTPSMYLQPLEHTGYDAPTTRIAHVEPHSPTSVLTEGVDRSRRSPVRSLFGPMRHVRRRSQDRRAAAADPGDRPIHGTLRRFNSLLRERLEERSRSQSVNGDTTMSPSRWPAKDPDTRAAELLSGVIPATGTTPSGSPPLKNVSSPTPVKDNNSMYSYSAFLQNLLKEHNKAASSIQPKGDHRSSAAVKSTDCHPEDLTLNETIAEHHLHVESDKIRRYLLNKYIDRGETTPKLVDFSSSSAASSGYTVGHPKAKSTPRTQVGDLKTPLDAPTIKFAEASEESILPMLKRLEQNKHQLVIPDYDKYIGSRFRDRPRRSTPERAPKSQIDLDEQSEGVLSDIEISYMISSNSIPREDRAFTRSMTLLCSQAEDPLIEADSDDDDMRTSITRRQVYNWNIPEWDKGTAASRIEGPNLALPQCGDIFQETTPFDMKGTLYDPEYVANMDKYDASYVEPDRAPLIPQVPPSLVVQPMPSIHISEPVSQVSMVSRTRTTETPHRYSTVSSADHIDHDVPSHSLYDIHSGTTLTTVPYPISLPETIPELDIPPVGEDTVRSAVTMSMVSQDTAVDDVTDTTPLTEAPSFDITLSRPQSRSYGSFDLKPEELMMPPEVGSRYHMMGSTEAMDKSEQPGSMAVSRMGSRQKSTRSPYVTTPQGSIQPDVSRSVTIHSPYVTTPQDTIPPETSPDDSSPQDATPPEVLSERRDIEEAAYVRTSSCLWTEYNSHHSDTATLDMAEDTQAIDQTSDAAAPHSEIDESGAVLPQEEPKQAELETMDQEIDESSAVSPQAEPKQPDLDTMDQEIDESSAVSPQEEPEQPELETMDQEIDESSAVSPQAEPKQPDLDTMDQEIDESSAVSQQVDTDEKKSDSETKKKRDDKDGKKKKKKKKKKKSEGEFSIENRPRPLRHLVDKQLKEGFTATVYIITSKKNATSSLCTVKFNYENDRLILETPNNVFDIDASKVVAEEIPTLPGAPVLLKLTVHNKKSSAVVIQSTQERNLNVLGGTVGWANAIVDQSGSNSQRRHRDKSGQAGLRLEGSRQLSHGSSNNINVTDNRSSSSERKRKSESRSSDTTKSDNTVTSSPSEPNASDPSEDSTQQRRSLISRMLLRRRINNKQ
ncbi:hypothetical protein BaOVIS_006180 [Babesia ovis]|uniref:Uncharacterized protein n=1 Tax=Babesia ovis TaxID=5869 RepID=A0A9W5TCM1_BABOV|nr:hypothetical protein BaOVIS_006180 [Babesia ovis]